uniref:Uncharacterized protein n=1 Tax=Panagrolaimus superbus TaxID=310955 RepID=A0A914Z1R2_9BILA
MNLQPSEGTTTKSFENTQRTVSIIPLGGGQNVDGGSTTVEPKVETIITESNTEVPLEATTVLSETTLKEIISTTIPSATETTQQSSSSIIPAIVESEGISATQSTIEPINEVTPNQPIIPVVVIGDSEKVATTPSGDDITKVPSTKTNQESPTTLINSIAQEDSATTLIVTAQASDVEATTVQNSETTTEKEGITILTTDAPTTPVSLETTTDVIDKAVSKVQALAEKAGDLLKQEKEFSTTQIPVTDDSTNMAETTKTIVVENEGTTIMASVTEVNTLLAAATSDSKNKIVISPSDSEKETIQTTLESAEALSTSASPERTAASEITEKVEATTKSAEQETAILSTVTSDSVSTTQEPITITEKRTESPLPITVSQPESITGETTPTESTTVLSETVSTIGATKTAEQTTTEASLDNKAPIVVLPENVSTVSPETATIQENEKTSEIPVKESNEEITTTFIPTTTDVIDKAVSKVQAIVAAAGKELKGETTILPSEDEASETTIVPLSEVKNESIPVIIDKVIEKVDEIVKENAAATTTSSDMLTESVTETTTVEEIVTTAPLEGTGKIAVTNVEVSATTVSSTSEQPEIKITDSTTLLSEQSSSTKNPASIVLEKVEALNEASATEKVEENVDLTTTISPSTNIQTTMVTETPLEQSTTTDSPTRKVTEAVVLLSSSETGSTVESTTVNAKVT